MRKYRDAWAAVRGRPWSFLTSAWPWRALAYVVSTVPLGIACLIVLGVTVAIGVATAVVVVGVIVLAGIPRLARAIAAIERRRLRLLLPGVTPPPAGSRWPEIGAAVLLSSVFLVVDFMVLGLLAAVVSVLLAPLVVRYDTVDVAGWQVEGGAEAWAAFGVGLVAALLSAYVVTWVACGQAALTRLLVAPPQAPLEQAVADLRRSRSGLVDAFSVERQRIERDLHDGVQQRLVALTMTLGSAELEADGPALQLIELAHQQAEDALADLRATVRGIHPQVLTDHGLAAAVEEIADRSPVPVDVDLAVDGRLPPAVETAAYFFVSEALTNIARHAQARSAQVHAWTTADTVVVTVVDDGVGGADPGRGTGLAGLAIRLEALDGEVTVSSPPGGPTEVRMTCPIR